MFELRQFDGMQLRSLKPKAESEKLCESEKAVLGDKYLRLIDDETTDGIKLYALVF